MGAIDVGSAATDRASVKVYGKTYLDLANPANASGTITSAEIWMYSEGYSCRVGTFYLDSGTTYVCRSSAAIGTVAAGSKQTKTGLAITVVAGDFIGFYCGSTGSIEASLSGGSNTMEYAGNSCTDAASQSYTELAGDSISCYGIGYAPEVKAVGGGATAIAGTLGRKTLITVGSGAVASAGVLVKAFKVFKAVGAGAIAIAGTLSSYLKKFMAVGGGAVTIAGLLNRLIKLVTGGGAVGITGTLNIDGVFIGETRYEWIEGSLSIDHRIEQRSTASFSVNDQSAIFDFYDGQPIEIILHGDIIFSGVIYAPDTERLERATMVRHGFTATSWMYLADKLLAAKSYENKTCGFIVNDLITSYLAAEGVTVGDVQAGPTITNEAVIKYARVSDAINELALRADFTWWIDYEKKLYFIDRATYAAPRSITPDEMAAGTAKFTRKNPTYRNRQYLRGPMSLTSVQHESRYGDNITTAFTVSYPLAKVPVITLNGGAQTVGIKGLDTGKDWYWSKGDPVIAQDALGVVLLDSDTLVIEYYGQFPIIILAEDNAGIASRKLLEGAGTGYVEEIKDATNVASEASAFELANGYLQKYGGASSSLSFCTRTSGLAPGQLALVTHPSFGLLLTEMLITAVQVTISGGGKIVYTVTAVQGPLQGDWTAFFKDLADKHVNIDNFSVGAGGTLTQITNQGDTWNWTESVVATVNACPMPGAAQYPKTILYPC
jgi:hypothetical protein